MRPFGSPEFLEYRRRLAVRLLDEGLDPPGVARVPRASVQSVQSVRRWDAARREGAGEAALAAVPHPGAPPRLTEAQAEEVLGWVDLSASAAGFGFATERWTAPRLASLIEARFGVSMNHRYLNDWLRRRGVTPQVPEDRPRERDEAAVRGWPRHQWPRVKKR